MKCATDCAVENSSGTDLGWREGMATWQPLAQISEFAQETGPRCSQPTAAIRRRRMITPGATVVPRSGLPWDDRQQKGIFTAFMETLQMVLTRPAEAFTAMKREGGFGEPLIYASHRRQRWRNCDLFLFSLALQSFGLFAESRNAFAMTGMGNWLGRIHHLVSARHHNWLIHRCRHYPSLLDDCWRSEPTF